MIKCINILLTCPGAHEPVLLLVRRQCHFPWLFSRRVCHKRSFFSTTLFNVGISVVSRAALEAALEDALGAGALSFSNSERVLLPTAVS